MRSRSVAPAAGDRGGETIEPRRVAALADVGNRFDQGRIHDVWSIREPSGRQGEAASPSLHGSAISPIIAAGRDTSHVRRREAAVRPASSSQSRHLGRPRVGRARRRASISCSWPGSTSTSPAGTIARRAGLVARLLPRSHQRPRPRLHRARARRRRRAAAAGGGGAGRRGRRGAAGTARSCRGRRSATGARIVSELLVVSGALAARLAPVVAEPVVVAPPPRGLARGAKIAHALLVAAAGVLLFVAGYTVAARDRLGRMGQRRGGEAGRAAGDRAARVRRRAHRGAAGAGRAPLRRRPPGPGAHSRRRSAASEGRRDSRRAAARLSSGLADAGAGPAGFGGELAAAAVPDTQWGSRSTMKCPKCQYLGFDGQTRCRHCGYDLSLAATTELPADVRRSGRGRRS